MDWRGGERREGIGMPDWMLSGLGELEARAGVRERILRRRIAMLREELARIEDHLKSSAEHPSQ